MDSYSALLEKTNVPQAAIQKYAVTAIFTEIRSNPGRLYLDSDPGRQAIAQCLRSPSPHVVDQAVRELCRLVMDEILTLSDGFIELQYALEESCAKFSAIFVKSLGFLTRLGFQRNSILSFSSPDNHPFVKVILCGKYVQHELVKEVVLLLGSCDELEIDSVCNFLKPFVNFSVLSGFSDPSVKFSSYFVRDLLFAMATFCCTFPVFALPVLKLLSSCFKLLPIKHVEDSKISFQLIESVVEAYIVVLRNVIMTRSWSISGVQCFGVELAGAILTLLTLGNSPYGVEWLSSLVKRLLEVQKELNLLYIPELLSVKLLLLPVLLQTEFEHEQLALLKLVVVLVDWKHNYDPSTSQVRCVSYEDLLFTLPVIHFMSSASKPVKMVATKLLLVLQKLFLDDVMTKDALALPNQSIQISSCGTIIYKFLLNLRTKRVFTQPPSFYLFTCSTEKTIVQGLQSDPNFWASIFREYGLRTGDNHITEKTFFAEMPQILSCIAGALVMDQLQGDTAVDLLVAIGKVEPKMSVTLLLAVLFYSNILTGNIINRQNLLTKILSVVPSLAVHSSMIPLVIQTIMPMLQKDGTPIMYATGIRLLSQAWASSDRTFGTLQTVLHPNVFKELAMERSICLSFAASVLDVCQRDPDRGVDLILCVSACIECQDQIIQSLGVQSLSCLCEADVIDFYSSWDIISIHLQDYSSNPILTHSVCVLLRWGALDAEAHPERVTGLLCVLWDVLMSMNNAHPTKWTKARASAVESLTQYEVSQMESGIHDFKKKFTNLLLKETNTEVLRAAEALQMKIIFHEHITRKRFVKQKRVARSKMEKLLDVVPQVLFPSGSQNVEDFPGAALICSPCITNMPSGIHTEYEAAATVISSSLQLSRNILIAFLSLQSWKNFLRHWIRADVMGLDSKVSHTAEEKTALAATNILKSLMKISQEGIPASAENVILAIGALCLIVPVSVHIVKSSASKFLLKWLFQYEHEYRQWPAAISLGLISGCLRVSDHKLRQEIICGLLEVLLNSKSTLVKGACGIGLGFCSESLLTRTGISGDIASDDRGYKEQEACLLNKIVSTVLLTLHKISAESITVLECLYSYFPRGDDFREDLFTSDYSLSRAEDIEEEDIWGVAGLVIGLGYSINAMYRFGAFDVVLKLKQWIISCIPKVDYLIKDSASTSEVSIQVLSVGACLVLPILVSLCRRVDIMKDVELDSLLSDLTNLICKLASTNNSNVPRQLLLTASCVGAGQLLHFILSEGVLSLEFNRVKNLLELFRKIYSGTNHSIVKLSGMVAVANAMGTGVGMYFNDNHILSSMTYLKGYQETGYLLTQSITNQIGESYLTSIIQELFLASQNANDLKMQQNAAWIVSFMRSHWWTEEHAIDEEKNIQIGVGRSKATPHKFSEERSVLKLSEWLSNSKTSILHPGPVTTVLRCLTRSPRLPDVNWGVIIRRCMRYKEQRADLMREDSVPYERMLQEQCILLSLAHANQFDAFLSLLDEISDFPRFRTLELNVQCSLLLRIGTLMEVFSDFRLDKFLNDVCDFFSENFPYSEYDADKKRLLRISCWNGLLGCLNGPLIEVTSRIKSIQKCIATLFPSLSFVECSLNSGSVVANSVEEWCAAITCLACMPNDWLLEFLNVPFAKLGQERSQGKENLKKVVAKAKLVRNGAISLRELGSLKSYLLNVPSSDIWNVLVEVAAAVQCAEGQIKRQWLCDTVDISCVSSFPSTAMRFLGLLCGSCCKYAPILLVDRASVLSDLPVTLNSLLSETSWSPIAYSVASNLWKSTERVYEWFSHSEVQNYSTPIDEIKGDETAFLLKVMHCTCLLLKDHLSLDNRIKLANMVVH